MAFGAAPLLSRLSCGGRSSFSSSSSIGLNNTALFCRAASLSKKSIQDFAERDRFQVAILYGCDGRFRLLYEFFVIWLRQCSLPISR